MAATRKTGHCSAVVQFGTRIPLSSPRSTKRAQFSEPSGIRTVICIAGGIKLRESALEGVAQTRFYPARGQARLTQMIAHRPDWTLSRQRQWGVPIACFIHKETGALHPRTLELFEAVAERIEQHGIRAWHAL